MFVKNAETNPLILFRLSTLFFIKKFCVCRHKLLPSRRGGVSGFGMAPQTRVQQPRDDGMRHRWGGGNRLGDQ